MILLRVNNPAEVTLYGSALDKGLKGFSLADDDADI